MTQQAMPASSMDSGTSHAQYYLISLEHERIRQAHGARRALPSQIGGASIHFPKSAIGGDQGAHQTLIRKYRLRGKTITGKLRAISRQFTNKKKTQENQKPDHNNEHDNTI